MRIAALQRFRATRHHGCARRLLPCESGVPVAGRPGSSPWCGRLTRMPRGKRRPHSRVFRDIGNCRRAVVAIAFVAGATTGPNVAQFQPITMVE
jgi:hypothetical protein